MLVTFTAAEDRGVPSREAIDSPGNFIAWIASPPSRSDGQAQLALSAATKAVLLSLPSRREKTQSNRVKGDS
jgi:hypothetical protein